MILCTSGSFGTPKGVSLSHAMLYDSLERFVEPAYRTNHNVLYFGHICSASGLRFLLIGTMYNFTRVITVDDFSPELFLCTIEKYQISFAFVWPYQVVSTLKCEDIGKWDLSSLKFLRTAGTRVPAHIGNDLSRLIPHCRLIIGYGMTESGHIAHNYPYSGVNAAGQLNHGITAKITNKNGNRIGTGEVGEICVRKMVTTTGYYGNRTRTEKLFDAEGFLKTGDVGYFDENGYLFVIDRMNFHSTYSDRAVSPLELEEYLVSFPQIKTAYVTLVNGKLLAALVARTEKFQTTEQDILDLITRKFDGRQHLDGGVFFIDSMPPSMFTGILKPKRDVIRNVAENFYNGDNK